MRYSLKCVVELVASTSHTKVPSKAPHWALTNVFQDSDFLSRNYCDQNKTACSKIYQADRHLNLPLDQKSHLQYFLGHMTSSNVICSTVFGLHSTQTTDNDDNKNSRQNETVSKQKSDFLMLYLCRIE